MNAFDLIVIGAGPGGYVAAIRAAKLGLKTACIEKDKTLGGTCLNVGCIPSKALLESTKHFAFFKNHANEHGIQAQSLTFDFQAMQERKSKVVQSLTSGVETLFNQNKVTWIKGSASFVDRQTVEVSGQKYTAKHFILATGSEPIPLPNLPFDEKKICSSTGVLALEKVPETMTVVGAGAIGLELASVYSRLGTKVNVVEMLDRICPGMDKDVSHTLQKILAKQGIVFHLKTAYSPESFPADVTLVAIGRRPYTEGLKLDLAGVSLTKGFVDINGNYQTSNSHVFAIGDLVKGVMLAHKASEEGIAVVDFIAGKASHVNLMAIPNVIYTSPEVASVGFTEAEARQAGLDVSVGMCQYIGNPRARASGEKEGFAKIIGDKTSGKLLGMHLICTNASEMIGEGVAAIEKGMLVKELASASHAHPTLSEAIKEAAMLASGKAIHY